MLVLLVWAYCESFALMRVVHSAKICEGGGKTGRSKDRDARGRTLAFFLSKNTRSICNKFEAYSTTPERDDP